MNTPFKKRSDPFAETPAVKVVEEKPVERKVVEKKVVEPKNDENREKYTATMEVSLRRRIKVAAAMTGIQVSTFIEQACLEKLEREGK